MLCDAELAAQRPDDALTGVLDPAAGTARHALLAIAADDRIAPPAPAAGLRPRPALPPATTPRCCSRRSSAAAEDRFKLDRVGGRARRPARLAAAPTAPSGCRARGWSWPRALLVEGTTARARRHPRAARRGLELPAAERAGRHDDRHHRRVASSRCAAARCGWTPPTREKVASNWDVVCVAPDLVRGSADYERFVRKHLHLFAPAEDGEVEAGPSHVHPELGPFAPPPVERFRALNRELLARAADRDGARERGRSARPTAASSCPPCWCASRVGTPRRRRVHRGRRARSISPSGSRSRTGLGGGAAFGVLGVAAERPAAARRPRARARRPRLGGRPPARGQEAAAARAPARRRRARRDRRLPGARRAERPRPPRSLTIEPRSVGLPALRAERRRRRRRASGSRPRSTSW